MGAWYTYAPLTKLDLHGLPTLLTWDHARNFTRLWYVDASVIEEGEVIHNREGRLPSQISSRVSGSDSHSHALEAYDFVGVYTRTLQPVESLSPP